MDLGGMKQGLAQLQTNDENTLLLRRLALQKIISQVSSDFIHLKAEDIDDHITQAVGRVADFLGFNAAAISKFASYGTSGHVGHIWTAPQIPAVVETFTDKAFPWSAECLLRGQDVMLPTMDALPPAGAVDRATFERYHALSSYSKVLRSGGRTIGALGLVSLGCAVPFPAELQEEIESFTQVLANALARERAATEINEALAFERMLTGISRRLLESPPGGTGEEVQRGLRSLADFFGVDRCAFWELSPDRMRYNVIHSFSEHSDGFPAFVDSSALPWFAQELRAGLTICLESLSDLPESAIGERCYWHEHGLKSAVLVPLLVLGRLTGCLSLAAVRVQRQWPPDLLRRLQLAGELFTNAVMRKHAQKALRQSEENLSLAADSAGAGLWSLDLQANSFWLTDKTREIFRLSADASLTWDDFLGLVHAGDRELVGRALREMLVSRRQGYVEYRVGQSSNDVRWFASRGRVHCQPSGEPDHLMGVTVEITSLKRGEQELLKSYAEIKELKDRLQAESDYLRQEIKVTQSHGEVVGKSPLIRKVLHLVEQVARTDSSVLIRGETGTGKELIANAIHRNSLRKDRVMVVVNCAALPSGLVESELFGRERGAYTGALNRQAGRFEVADQSTLFLDEIGELSLDMQAKLLRVLEVGVFERLGSSKTIKTNVRLVAATNRDLREAVTQGKFREDLYYRLNVFPILIPPLRERLEDIPELVWAFVQQFSRRMGKKITKIPRKAMETLQGYDWPGNVRQLRNIIEHSVIISAGDKLKLAMPEELSPRLSRIAPLADQEREIILEALEFTKWRIKGPKGAASKLGLKPSTLYGRMGKLGIPTRREKPA